MDPKHNDETKVGVKIDDTASSSESGSAGDSSPVVGADGSNAPESDAPVFAGTAPPVDPPSTAPAVNALAAPEGPAVPRKFEDYREGGRYATESDQNPPNDLPERIVKGDLIELKDPGVGRT